MARRYYRIDRPAADRPAGMARLSLRVDGQHPGLYGVQLSVGSTRLALTVADAWAVYQLLAVALPATWGPAPEWATADRVTGPHRPEPEGGVGDDR